MNDVLVGGKHRYYIESVVDTNELGVVYKSFARRRVGKKIVRRYYAIVERKSSVSASDFYSALTASTLSIPYSVYEEERFDNDGNSYVVISKGKQPRQPNPRWQSLQNHGYLMLLFAALILVLMIVRFFQSPADQPALDVGNVPEMELFDN